MKGTHKDLHNNIRWISAYNWTGIHYRRRNPHDYLQFDRRFKRCFKEFGMFRWVKKKIDYRRWHYIFYGKYNDGNEYVYGMQIRHEVPYTLITFGDYFEDFATVDIVDVAEYYGFDLSAVTDVQTSVYDEENYDYIEEDNLISYEISSNEFKFKPLIEGILSIEFYAGNEYLGNIEFKATKHGKGFIFE